MRIVLAVALLAMLAAPGRADEAMTAAARGFYAVSLGARPASGGGIPDSAGRVRFTPLLSQRLNRQLAEAAAAETRFRAKHKNAPPLIEGDIFSSLFEGPTEFRLGDCVGNAGQARCAVSLTRQDPGRKAVTWNDTLILANEGGWKVDDIVYDAHFAFGNTGTLSETLKMTLAMAP